MRGTAWRAAAAAAFGVGLAIGVIHLLNSILRGQADIDELQADAFADHEPERFVDEE